MGRLPGALLLALGALACAPDGGHEGAPETSVTLRQGDLDEIHERGTLRVLLPKRIVVDQLPRGGTTLDHERQLIEQFARDEGLKPIWIRVASREALIAQLLDGRGDIVAANLTASEERKRRVDFTVPVSVVREQLIGWGDDPSPVRTIEDLAGRRIYIRKSSSFWATVDELREKQPGLIVEAVAEDLETEEILHRVATGAFDLTVADSNLVDACLSYNLNIDTLMDLTGDRVIGFAVRPDSKLLLDRVNRFLSSIQLQARSKVRRTDDLDEMRKRRVLRVLTRNTAATYFLWRGQLKGFEYEFAGEFARAQGLRLEMIVPREGESLYDLLREGRGDLIAAALTPPPERHLDGVTFSRPYNFVSHFVVARAGEPPPQHSADLRGRTFHVQRSSTFWRTLAPLEKEWGFKLVAAPESLQIAAIIDLVASGDFDLTLADSQAFAIERSWRDDAQQALTLRGGIPLSWAVRESNPQLREAVDAFIQQSYRGLFYNVIHDRYFGDRPQVAEREFRGDQLSPYDDIVKKFAADYGFDWRMVVAQMFQESQFHRRAQSFAGARGLMQIMPATATELGVEDLDDPEKAILAGIRYLDWVRDRFEPQLPVQDRMWFTLAAYNAGPGHVRDARRLAREIGLHPNRWFENVEKAMLLLSKPEYSSNAAHGYCRCGEPVAYVRQIRERYNAYVEARGNPAMSGNTLKRVETVTARLEYE
jgi:membrane-bound lytic murein transglycosylase F